MVRLMSGCCLLFGSLKKVAKRLHSDFSSPSSVCSSMPSLPSLPSLLLSSSNLPHCCESFSAPAADVRSVFLSASPTFLDLRSFRIHFKNIALDSSSLFAISLAGHFHGSTDYSSFNFVSLRSAFPPSFLSCCAIVTNYALEERMAVKMASATDPDPKLIACACCGKPGSKACKSCLLVVVSATSPGLKLRLIYLSVLWKRMQEEFPPFAQGYVQVAITQREVAAWLEDAEASARFQW